MDDIVIIAFYTTLFQSNVEGFAETLQKLDPMELYIAGDLALKILDKLDDPAARAKLLSVFAVGFWGKGYDAAPKLEFIVTEEEDDPKMPQL